MVQRALGEGGTDTGVLHGRRACDGVSDGRRERDQCAGELDCQWLPITDRGGVGKGCTGNAGGQHLPVGKLDRGRGRELLWERRPVRQWNHAGGIL